MIDRKKLVTRHNPKMTEFEPLTPLSVGNGDFTFTADLTGLQTFPQIYEKGMPLCTQSSWGWHSYTTPAELIGKQLKLAQYDTFGRKVGYHTDKTGQEELFNWLRINPHRFHLGQIGLELRLGDGSIAQPTDLHNCVQKLDLWTGIITSQFTIEDIPVTVITACHPYYDMLLVSVDSKLIELGRLVVKIAFPYGSHDITGADWKQCNKHKTISKVQKDEFVQWVRILDDEHYYCTIQFTDKHQVKQQEEHVFYLTPSEGSDLIEFSCLFSLQAPKTNIETYPLSMDVVKDYWSKFWLSGGAVELANSKDSRAFELERRIVLSQYLTAIQCSGNLPPQETGLTCNSWYGKAHLEMHWWHAVHFALWGRPHLLENSLWWYDAILAKSKKHAQNQGYDGVRWPKMVGPDGVDSPSSVGPLLIWQQPHPIIYAELMYSYNPNGETLQRYKEIVFQTAEFMADFAHYDQENNRYVLGAPLIPAQENHKAMVTLNPTYELEYWLYALKIAQTWRKRLGMPLNETWAEIIEKLSPLPVKNGIYLAHERCPDTFNKYNIDHPSMLCALGVLPGYRVDTATMRSTLLKVLECWHWDRAWGWDFPVVAMTAARVGEPNLAIDALFIDSVKNTWLANGHNYQRPNLPLYLPGNGALLLAIAIMAAGWLDGPSMHAPGFPQDGSWTVQWEGLYRLI